MSNLSADQLCARINQQLPGLSFRYEANDRVQTLELSGHAKERFLVSAGGGVAGGSAAWIHAKHMDGNIHEPGLIATLLAIAELYTGIDTIFDIGALYGYIALLGKAIFPNAEVHAFEANPNSFDALQNNIAANTDEFGGSIIPHHCALSDMSIPKALLRIHGFRVETVTRDEGGDDEAVSEIDVWSIDDFCDARSLSPDIIKIDVEGYQAKILPGAMSTISRKRPLVLLEFDGSHCVNNFGITNKEVIKPLVDMGYRLIWGKHRNKNASFRVLDWAALSDAQEINSLGILVPG